MKRIFALAAGVVAAAVMIVPVAGASAQGGPWLGLGKGKSAIRNEVAFYQVGTRFAQKVSLC